MRAFLKKEWLEQFRSARLWILGAVFVAFGAMSPAIAKLTPWLMDAMSDALAGTGLSVGTVTVSALDAWVQFFKNIPMALIVLLILQSRIFTREYRSGTLVLVLTKGLPRYQVVLAKTCVLGTLWTAGYWLCFGITYGITACFWDNAMAQELGFAAVCWWAFGLWTVALTVLFSTVGRSNIPVLAGCGGTVLGCYLVSALPKVGAFSPATLTDGSSLIFGLEQPRHYVAALAVTAVTAIAAIAASIPVMNKKQL